MRITIIILAIAINLLLFYLIQQMVSGDRSKLSAIEDIEFIDFVRLERDIELPEQKPRQTTPEKPPPPEEPRPLPIAAKPELRKISPEKPRMPTPQIDLPLRITGGPYLGDTYAAVSDALAGPAAFDKDVRPTLKIPPVYPPQALRSGIEGVVTVEFTIAKNGTVKDPIIVEAKPEKIFDRAVLRAISKWKFNVKTVNGKPVERRARQDVRFTLQE
ncbi:MAG: TonB family protein [Gammaproteobacteria bacterium]|nr:TonB family protein [Gammaproteobacteria bacterium]